jgi:hypothetical protein
MKRIFLGILLIILLTSCTKNSTFNNIENEKTMNEENIEMVKITINDNEYDINLEDNNTVKELLDILPLTITMNELNGNEFYAYLDESFSVDSHNPKTINKGDVMLYGNNCLVIFYKSFDTSYSYTKIGHIDNLDDLDNKDVLVKFNMGED